MSGYVPLPAPVTADPNFWKQGVENLNALRDQQAKQASADAYRQSTDPATGQVDVPKYNALIARGPGAWNAGALMQQQGQAANAQASAGTAQVAKASAIYNMAGTAAASLMKDPSNENIDNVEAGLRTSGAPPEVLAELDRIKGIPDLEQRKVVAYQHTLSMMDAQHRMAVGGFPTPTVTQFGGTSAPVTITPASPYGPSRMDVGGGVAHTVDPATYNAPQSSPIMLDANGQPTNDPTKAVRSVPRDVPRGPAFGMPPPGSVGGPPSSGGPPPSPGGLPPGAPPPPAGMVLKGGVFQPRAAAPAPAPNAATPPVPSAVTPPVVSTSTTLRGPGSAATPPAATPRALPPAAPSPTAGVVTGMPTGRAQATETEQEASQKQFIADRTALPQRQTQEQNLNHAYDALKLVTSGRGTETASQLRNLLVTAGVAGAATANDEALYEIGRKYTERTIADAGNAGGTDTARAVAASSNPNVSLINPANLAFLRNDIGKVRQQMAAYMTAPDKTIGTGYGEHSANTASNTDYRGFNWDMYSPAEQKEIEKSVGKEGTKPHDALARAIGMGRSLWPQKGAGPIVPHAQAAPMMPPPNMLAMAQPQQNALQPA